MVLQEFGFSVTKEMVTVLIKEHLKETGQPNSFTNDRAWWESFLSDGQQLLKENHNTFLKGSKS